MKKIIALSLLFLTTYAVAKAMAHKIASAKILVKAELKMSDKELINGLFVIENGQYITLDYEEISFDLLITPENKQAKMNLIVTKDKELKNIIANEVKKVNWGEVAEFKCPNTKGNQAVLRVTADTEN